MIPFNPFPSLSRLNREVIVTEKIDGTNAQIYIPELPDEADGKPFLVGSRTKWITPEQDNYGFARWAYSHVDELLQLGPGAHFGEWWGNGIQRTYGLNNGDKRFSLFNVSRWSETRPACCGVVPVVWQGLLKDFFATGLESVERAFAERGSVAAPGFGRPEGIVIYHTKSRELYKYTFDGDAHKFESKEK